MTYVYNFDEPPAVSEEESLLLLGGKGHNLTVMRRDLGLPVPPGFTITTEVGQAYMSEGWPDGLEIQLQNQMARIEEEVGRHFDNSGEPLLVSVRSGAAVSMPGMMETILNLGLSDENVDALAAACGDPDFANESRQRLEKMYREIVGVDTVPADPWEQLRGAIDAVFKSWNTNRARSYREREGIPHDRGTAVTVQAMVFGNIDDDSGTGVLFTRNPATGEPTPYGDVLFRAQGEDVVAGTHRTESIDRLAEHLPEVARELTIHSKTLERHFRDVCDIEFTIERAKLWFLQVRVGKRSPQAALRFAVDMAEEDDFPLTREEAIERVAGYLADPPVSVTHVRPDIEPLAAGLPASPGIASGRIATTADSAVSMADEGSDVILVRPETSPHDVHGMSRAKGILTSRGGLASHAAVVARGWGTPAVVGAETVDVKDGTVVMADRTFGEGDVITINGGTGEIFVGVIETEMVASPAGQRLLKWAKELEIDIPSLHEPNQTETSALGDEDRAVSPEDIIRALHIKGFVTADALAPVVMSSVGNVAPILEILATEGLIKAMGEMYQLTDEGRERGESLMSQDRQRWSEEKANRALEGFLPLDSRMKVVVTAWQMREVDGEQVINDHSDQEYDHAVLEDFYQLHDDARAWLDSLTGELARLGFYLARLDRAVAEVRGGDHAHVASPRIDSYHNAWFELHEDLIQLAGRTREQEVETGRA